MQQIKFCFKNYSWGANKDELHQIDVGNALYQYFEHGKCLKSLNMSQNVLAMVCDVVEKICEDFPQSEFAYDAPIWTLQIDEKYCTRIADKQSDAIYRQLSEVFLTLQTYSN